MSDTLKAVEQIRGQSPYQVPRAPTPIDLCLDGNEGVLPPTSLLEALGELDGEALRRYPKTAELESTLAVYCGVEPSQLVVTAGADDGIDRICRAVLEPGKNAVIPVPTFEMVPRFAALTGAEVRRVESTGGVYPVEGVLRAVDESTSLIVMISPNNPTGIAATDEQIEEIARRCPQSLVLVDHAYVEFSDQDFTDRAPTLPNVVVTRTLSKAWGLAGLRVGYAVACERVIGWLRTVGGPYPVSKLSLAIANRWITRGVPAMRDFVDHVIEEREALQALFEELGHRPSKSRANFAFARVGDGLWWRDALAGQGIGVRAFPDRPGLEDAIRIACPGDRDDIKRVESALRTVGEPEAILFDLDGVFADVSHSYRRAVLQTAASFGVDISTDEVSKIKARGNANNDWRVTRELLAERGVEASLEEVTRRFEEFYQGTDDTPGLWTEEQLLVGTSFFDDLAERNLHLGIVTGRPRKDAERFLDHFDIDGYFDTVVCMEDGPLKPDPAPVQLAMQQLGVTRGWFIGDTPDDIHAGRQAGLLPLGVVAPEENDREMTSALLRAGAGRVFAELEELLEVLP